MISDRNKGIQNLVLICQCILVTVAFWLWLLLSYLLTIDHQVINRYIVYNEVVIVGLLIGSRPLQRDSGLRAAGFEQINRLSFRQLGATLFYLLLYLVAAQDERISRLFLFSFVPLLYLVLFSTNRYLPRLLGHITFRRGQQQKVVLLGPQHKALGVKRWLDENKHLGLEILGLLTEDTATQIHKGQQTPANGATNGHSHISGGSWLSGSDGAQTLTAAAHAANAAINSVFSLRLAGAREETTSHSSVPISNSPDLQATWHGQASSAQLSTTTPDDPLLTLGRPEDLEKVLTTPGVMKVIMVEFPRANEIMGYYINLCEARGIRLLVVADIDEIFGHPVTLFEDQGLCLMSLREEPLENPINRFLKRCMDIAVSAFALVFVLPVLGLALWYAQRLQSPGPLFYLQTRPGFRNRPFNIYKFRTLHVTNPEENKLPGPGDPRVYPAGRFFRKYSLDEIPQFWNVLRGDMSVVGPRPHLMVDNERFPRLFNKAYVRSYVKPGITGLAQARGFRGKAETTEDVARRMESDIEYLENWSLWSDCWLILRTAFQMVLPPNTAV